MTMFYFSLELICIPIVIMGVSFLSYLIQTTPSTIINLNHRYQKTGSIGALLLGIILLIKPEPNYLLYSAVVGFLIFHYCCGFTVRSIYISSLTVVPSPWNKQKVQVHLATLSQPLDKEVYQDLFLLLDELQAAGITTVVLTSPLFTKQKRVRSTLFFQYKLKQKGIELESKPIPFYTKPWSCCLLAFQKYLLRTPSLQSLPLTRWHQYTLRLPSRSNSRLSE
ncbi:hypothetical protein [Aliivibrio fischeri]|nr:hypothetical protein [Aliivibrio fischeri]